MIITIRRQVSSEERNQLTALLQQLNGGQRPTISTLIDEHEVIVLDDSQLDAQVYTAIRLQGAVERVIQVQTPYKLVSRAFKAERSSILVGDVESNQCYE